MKFIVAPCSDDLVRYGTHPQRLKEVPAYKFEAVLCKTPAGDTVWLKVYWHDGWQISVDGLETAEPYIIKDDDDE